MYVFTMIFQYIYTLWKEKIGLIDVLALYLKLKEVIYNICHNSVGFGFFLISLR